MQRILEGIRSFQNDVYPKKRGLFQRLSAGQNPEALFIACSDSRLALDLITQTGPGDLFVCRNAGNIVPAHGQSDAVSATIEYAVSALRIRHLVVCGHSDCGAMKGLLHPDTLAGMPHVAAWLRNSEGARRAIDSMGLDPGSPGTLDAVTRLNVRLQMEHLRTHPHVFAQVEKGNLQIHGWVYQIGSGEVHAWDAARGQWRPHLEQVPGPETAPAPEALREAQHA
jgi:carbonic anhydrase